MVNANGCDLHIENSTAVTFCWNFSATFQSTRQSRIIIVIRLFLFYCWIHYSHMLHKSRTASYLAMRHIWHDTSTHEQGCCLSLWESCFPRQAELEVRPVLPATDPVHIGCRWTECPIHQHLHSCTPPIIQCSISADISLRVHGLQQLFSGGLRV